MIFIQLSSTAKANSDTPEPTDAEIWQQQLEESLIFHGFPSVNRFEFTDPDFSNEESLQILSEYNHLDPQNLIPDLILEQAVKYFEANKTRIKNQKFMSIIDYRKHSGQRRFFVIDMGTGKVEALHTAHGKKGDLDDDGYATEFSNVLGSNMSSIGFAVTAETYMGANKYSLRMDGLQDTNSKLRERYVVIHKSEYVHPDREKMGRSEGCPAIPVSVHKRVIDQIKGGSLVYKYYNQ
jgi:hypothetical protein